MALVRSLTGVCVKLGSARPVEDRVLTSQKVALQVLQMQVRFVAVRALILAICVLCRGGGRLSSSRSWSARVRGQDAATALLTDNVHRLRFLVRKHRGVRVQRRVVHTHTSCWATKLVSVVVSGRGGQQRSLRVCRRHGHVGGRRLNGPQRRVL
jgi:hypothetical protein